MLVNADTDKNKIKVNLLDSMVVFSLTFIYECLSKSKVSR